MSKNAEKKIPTPEEAKIEVGQESSSHVESTLTVLESKEGISTFPVSSGIESLGEGEIISRSGAKTFLQACVRMTEHNLYYALQERDRAFKEADKWKTDYHEMKSRVGILEERIRMLSQQRLFQNALVTIGSLMAGAGLTQSPSLAKLTEGTTLFGMTLCLVGWMLPLVHKEKN